jgi:ElaB/YqjD/DUF883 family membrane-anchored ribosome-binding protein
LSGQFFLRATDVAGSNLHNFVYAAGKFIGFKFQPWQAVNIAKGIGNAAKFLGPAMAVIAIGVDFHMMLKEKEHEQKMADVRRDIISQFRVIAVNLEQHIDAQRQEFENKVYGTLEQNIAEARQQTESAMASSSSELGQLATIRDHFESMLKEIQQAAIPEVF